MVANMIATRERKVSSFGWWSLVVFLWLLFVGNFFFYTKVERWLPEVYGVERLAATFIASLGGIIWFSFAFRIVSPAFAGLVFRFGSRVITSETVRYFRIVDGEEQDIPADELDFADVKSVVISVEYLTKKEGWTFIFPAVERILEISLRQHREEINEKKPSETDEEYLKRAESFSTAEGVDIIPEMFYSYKITNPGKVFELGGGIDENGDSLFLAEMFHNLIMGGTRDVLARMELTNILSRTIEENGTKILIGEKIRGEIVKTPNFDRLGAELLILRIEAIKFTKEAQDVLDALENVKKQKLEKEAEIIEAEKRLEIQKKDSETLVNKSGAELTEARNKAAALNAAIAAFVGKGLEDKTTSEEGQAYAQYQIGLAIAKSLETGTKVIIPATDMAKTISGLVNVYAASKP